MYSKIISDYIEDGNYSNIDSLSDEMKRDIHFGHLHQSISRGSYFTTQCIIKYMKCPPIDDTTYINISAGRGDMSMIKLLREYHFKWSSKAYVYAAIGGYNHVIKYLHKNNCPIDYEVKHILEGYGIRLYPIDKNIIDIGPVVSSGNVDVVPVVDSDPVVDPVPVNIKSIDEFLRERLCGFDECYHFNQGDDLRNIFNGGLGERAKCFSTPFFDSNSVRMDDSWKVAYKAFILGIIPSNMIDQLGERLRNNVDNKFMSLLETLFDLYKYLQPLKQ